MADEAQVVINIIELWKAIHGGCWPGPPPNDRLSVASRDILQSLSLIDSARGIADKHLAAGLTAYGVKQLNTAVKSINALGGGG